MRRSPIVLLTVLASGCVSAPRTPPSPPPAPQPAPAPAPPPLAADWRDWPLTVGGWRYSANASGSTAAFGTAGSRTFALSCDRNARRVALTDDRAPGTAAMTVRTTSVVRTLPVAVASSTSLAANDPLLDALAFSRGRFVVERSGAAPLVLPAWAEVGRVVQDCRG